MHKVMLSDVIVNIFNSDMTLYLNIMKAQGFYILLRLFPFSQNRQGIRCADNWPVDNWLVDNWPVTFLGGRTIGR